MLNKKKGKVKRERWKREEMGGKNEMGREKEYKEGEKKNGNNYVNVTVNVIPLLLSLLHIIPKCYPLSPFPPSYYSSH